MVPSITLHDDDCCCGPVSQHGEPICDYFECELYEGRTLVCIADGCSWGEQSRQAARKATEAYMGYLRDNQRSITDLRDAGRLILRAFQKAHIKILEGTAKPSETDPLVMNRSDGLPRARGDVAGRDHYPLWRSHARAGCGRRYQIDPFLRFYAAAYYSCILATMKRLKDLRRIIDTAPMKTYNIEKFISTLEKDHNSPLTIPPYNPTTHDQPPIPISGTILCLLPNGAVI